MNRSVLIAAIILVAIVAYFGLRSVMRGSISTEQPAAEASTRSDVPQALVIEAQSQRHTIRIAAKGRTAPDKSVTLKAGTAGTVVATPVREGTFVKAGTLLCGLDVEARSARVKEAEAARDSARVDYEAAVKLAEKGLTPANREASAKASLDAAEAAVNSAKVELSRTQIRAPFDGVFERRMAEAGDYLSPGGACGLLVDLDPVIVAAEVTEAQAGLLQVGMAAEVVLADGRKFPAKLRFVARTANEQTRTFPIEAELDTGDALVAAGITASMSIPAGETDATLIKPSLLTLSDAGQLGVRHVTENNTVAFAPVRIIDETSEGAWVTGLPDRVRLIAMGQDYLNDGVTIKPVSAEGAGK
ncbi:RND family efflux transporter MFP subunit [Hyphomonas polymorpha PS728]|uniref:RND family efflux transporter MFP subunit n=1 Tax=Hyphomonas polymorpha PS728 TaxID=1280954 RepID=A0A062VDN9_9PROT|nr:efflux RND transporter periplasmic adaptor subunit [Hyphomonas polymorpha]KDA00660.1 RND family efflux transporter MFP subunit [Hyphomonas polymorpha PS728]